MRYALVFRVDSKIAQANGCFGWLIDLSMLVKVGLNSLDIVLEDNVYIVENTRAASDHL